MSSDTVRLAVSHSVLKGNENWKTFSKALTVKQLKDKLYMIVGTEPQYQQLQLKEKSK